MTSMNILNYTMDVFLNTTYLQHPENFSDHNLQCRWRYDTRQTAFVQSAIWKMNPGIFLKQFHISLPGIKRKMEHFALSNTYVILILHIYAPTQKNCNCYPIRSKSFYLANLIRLLMTSISRLIHQDRHFFPISLHPSWKILQSFAAGLHEQVL